MKACEDCYAWMPTQSRLGICVMWSEDNRLLLRFPQDRCWVVGMPRKREMEEEEEIVAPPTGRRGRKSAYRVDT